MNLHLDDKLALVTAMTGGIGKAIATTLAREGATVIVNGRTAVSVDPAIADIRAHVPGAKLEKLVADNGSAEGAAKTLRTWSAAVRLLRAVWCLVTRSPERASRKGRTSNTLISAIWSLSPSTSLAGVVVPVANNRPVCA
jgi:nucleoside-diphosphate-sugar epimerase